MVGIGVVDGIAIQKVFIYSSAPRDGRRLEYLGAEQEGARLASAFGTAERQLAATAERLAREAGEDEAGIIEYQINILRDKVFADKIAQLVVGGASCEDAVTAVCSEYCEIFGNLDNDYLQQRKIDIIDIQARLLGILGGREGFAVAGRPAIIAAEDLAPSQVAEMDPKRVKGILLEKGGKSSHSVILAQSLGIPCIIGLTGLLGRLGGHETVIMDGSAGTVTIDPDAKTLAAYRRQLEKDAEAKKSLLAYVPIVPATRDGVRVNVYANIASAVETGPLLESGGEGVGLLRTELLYMGFSDTPSREAQFKAYSKIAESLGQRPLIIRTLDAGGDKEIPYLGIGEEANTFLGYRAIRYCLDHEALFKDQIAAILQAARHGNVKMMFPMIATMDELFKAKALVAETKAELLSRGVAFADVPIGMMMEVPAAALMADLFAKHVDFFSIGTNDLAQYLFAADRNNGKVAYLNSFYHPALIRCVNAICAAAKGNGLEVDICGRAGEAPDLIPLWAAMGVSGLSVSIPSIPAVKKAVCETDTAASSEILAEALQLSTAQEVLDCIKDVNGGILTAL